ncbi:mucin-binding protein [Limosilactobacillus balticus]|uniref:mucin-binding protein n=1 Tax=Limosilactobacillus balticus TaxID=2759747 RepID=UPI001F31615F|nr:PT domain-containing protein [Limosilactobacillus balticus]
MSKNNTQEYVRKMEPQRQRFGLRKLSVGVASVLLGTTFMVGGTVAHADNIPIAQEATTANTDITEPVSTSAVQADKQTNGEQNSVENTSSNPQKEQQLVNKTSDENTDQLNNEKNQELLKDNEYESIANLNKNNVNTQNTPVEESKVSQAATEQNARIDLTFVDDDDNGKIVDYSEYLPSENNGHHYAYGKVGDKVNEKAYNNGTMSIERMLKILGVWNYKPAGAYQAPTEFTSPEMSFQIHLKHQTRQKEYDPITLTRTIHYRHTMATDGKTMQDDQGKEVPDYKVKYQITPTVTFDLVTNEVKNGIFNVKNLTTDETYTIASKNNRLVVDYFDPIMSPDVSQRWKPQVVETTESFDKLPDLNYWKLFANGNISDNQSVVYKVDYTKIKIGDYVPNDELYYNTDIEESADGTKETVYRYFYYGMTDENDEGVNIDHVTKQHYAGRQALEFTRTKTVGTDGQVTYGKWIPVTTDTFPEYNYNDNYQVKGYDGQYSHAPAVKYYPNDPTKNGGMSVFDPYGPLYKVSIIDDVTGETLNTYKKNPVPEAGDDYQYTRDRAEKTRQSIYDQVDKYKSKGYTVVSDDFGSISINNTDNANHSEGTDEDAKYVYTIHLTHKATPHTDSKIASRTIHYVANTKDGKQLLDDTTQKVTLRGVYYTDATDPTSTKLVHTKTTTDGELVVDTSVSDPAEEAWTVDAHSSQGLTADQKNLAAVTTPETISLTDSQVAKRGVDSGNWYLIGTDANGEVSYGDPTASTWKDELPDGYLIYKQKAQYNIHYVDVNGVEGKDVYTPTDGKELNDHHISNIGSANYVGDTPDATNNLWTNYEKEGYVLVGLSNNATDGKLGKQTLTHDVQDQYVYLKHAAKVITPNTPVDEVPKNSSVKPEDLSKSADRIIHYVTEKDKTPLLDDTTQKVTFEGTAYVDAVNGKLVQPEEGTDALTGGKALLALTTPGKITWTATAGDGSTVDDHGASFNEVTKPVITDGKLAGKWLVTKATANNAKQDGTDLDPASKNFDAHREVTLEYVKDVKADITYWDITDGMDHKVQLGNTDPASDSEGRPNELIHFNNNEKRISDLENAGYVFVDTDYHNGDKYGTEDSHFNVYLRHAVKNITPNTPAKEVPKNPDGTPAVDPSDLHKEFTRNITFVANNDDKSTLSDPISQKVTFDGHIYVDVVTGQATTPETIKNANGENVQVATTKAGKIEWNHETQTMDGVRRQYITLKKGDKYATSDDMVGTWHWISGTADEITLTPTSDNPEDLQLVYEKNEHETGPDEDHDLPKVDVKQETKTFTRTVVYHGTKDGGKTYQDVNGSPDGKNTYKQTVIFTRNVFSTTNKDGKVTILETDPWTTTDSTMGRVDSKKPSEVGYDEVDTKFINARTIDPNKDTTDLGTFIVTYTATPTQPTEQPTEQPTSQPTVQPTEQPTSQPTVQPTEQPTSQPTVQPTEQPTSQPTVQPTEQPTSQPTVQPTEQPTSQPTVQPTEQPTSQPTVQPTEQPTSQPTVQPTEQPTSQPTVQPTEQPTSQPTAQPTEQPTSQPTVQPTEQPTSQPTAQPTEQPTSQPTAQPTEQPTVQPTEQPTSQPTAQPTEQPTSQPTAQPTEQPTAQSTTKQGAQQLPQTGNQKSSSLIGLGFAGLLSALGLTKVNKKRKD